MGKVAIVNIPVSLDQPHVFIFAEGHAVPDEYVTSMGIEDLVVEDPNSANIRPYHLHPPPNQ